MAPSSLVPGERKHPLLDVTQRAYAAGVIDCDGAIWICRSSRGRNRATHSVRVNVTNTRPELIDWFSLNLVGSSAGQAYTKNPRAKAVSRWQATSLNAKHVLEQVLPFLVLKREQALVALEFCSTLEVSGKLPDALYSMREELYQKMRKLNKRGAL